MAAALLDHAKSVWRFLKLGALDGHDERPAFGGRPLRRYFITFAPFVLAFFGIIILYNNDDIVAWRSIPTQQSSMVGTATKPPYHDSAQKHLVIASFNEQDVGWLKKIPSSWTIKRYFMDNQNPPEGGLTVPKNKGREAMAYLTYIIDHYDNLPDYAIFTHGHERSWHQIESLSMKVRALNLTALDHEHYISLRCGDQMGCEQRPYLDTEKPNWDGEKHLRDFWKTVLPKVKPPKYISFKCCAQHAVTRTAIQTRTKAEWESIRMPLLREAKDYSWGNEVNDWLLGTFYEKYWHVWLGANEEYCPSTAYCQQVQFSNAILCDGDIDRTLFEGETWKEVRCISAFDDLEKDAPSDKVNQAITNFRGEILGLTAKIRGEASERLAKALEALHKQDNGRRHGKRREL